MNSDGLADFGTGAFEGGATGAKVSGGNPYAIAGGAIIGGSLSYFGGASQRRTEAKNNRQALELGGLEVVDARRKSALEEQRRRRQEMFGQLLAQFFQKQQGAK